MTTPMFNAAVWLRAFKAVGGTFATLPDGEWFIGWRLDRELDDDEARALFNQVKDEPDRIAAIKVVAEPGRMH